MPFFLIALATALLISTVSAFFNISGMVAIFPGAVAAAIAMGIVLELGKLVSVTFAYRYWKISKFLTRIFVGMILVLSLITAIDIFGYLSKAHIIGERGIDSGQSQIVYVQTQIGVSQNTIRAESTDLAQMDRIVNNYLTDSSKTDKALRVRNSQQRERRQSQTKIDQANADILALQHQRDSLSNVQHSLEVNIGPLKYLSALAGLSDPDKVVRWFIAIIVCVFDPLAILLLIGASVHLRTITDKSVKTSDLEPQLIKTPESKVLYTKSSEMPHIDEKISKPVTDSPITVEKSSESEDFGFTAGKRILKVEHPH